MKKVLFIGAFVIVALIGVFSCLHLTKNNDTTLKNDIAGVVSVENYINLDEVYMDSVNADYKWFETCIKLTGEVDTLQEPTLEMVTNIFQVNTPTETGFTSVVYGGKHSNRKSWFDTINGFWVEDNDMRAYTDSIITFEAAFNRLQEANCPKPKSIYCTLRKQIGPHPSNPQWIFGNDNRGIVYVDAITGEVSTINPVFPDKTLTLPVLPDSLATFVFNK